jgi:ABC-type multidrug transport system ATPase subunit
MKPILETVSVGMTYGTSPVLADIDLRFETPQMVALAGPNGAGKSTLLGIMAGLRSGYSGSCRL